MLASVHIANVTPVEALSLLRKRPKPSSTPGLRFAQVALAAPLGGGVLPRPSFHRVGCVAFWDDDAAIDAFEAEHPLAQRLAQGWSARLEPLRAHGVFPGLDPGIPRPRRVDANGPFVVLTLGNLRLSQAVRFFRASAKAEAAVVNAPGLIWATGLGRPPFLATCSLWENADAISAYAFNDREAPHPSAIDQGRAKPFHKQEAFIRFHPTRAHGSLDGKNPLPEHALAIA